MPVEGWIEEDKRLISAGGALRFLRQKVIFGDCRAVDNDDHAACREAIAENFSIHPNHVVVVGSSKLGYSVSPEKKFRPYGDSSDLDIAIVNNRLFETFWQEMHGLKASLVDWPEFGQARNYLFNGWMRPDKLPVAEIRRKWFDFFTDLQRRGIGGGMPVKAGLYHDWYFLESYQLKGIQACFLPEVAA